MDIFSKLVKVGTFGVANITEDGIVLKDPITGVADIIKNTSDAIFRDEREGVWIGNRLLGDSAIGVSSAALRTFHLDIMHQAVMVEGQAYSLVNDKGGIIKIKKINELEKSKYDWRYRGKSSYNHIDSIVDEINKSIIDYNLVLSNCQDVSDALSKYALDIYDRSVCLSFIFPEVDYVGLAAIFNGQGEIFFRRMKAVQRASSDLETIFK